MNSTIAFIILVGVVGLYLYLRKKKNNKYAFLLPEGQEASLAPDAINLKGLTDAPLLIRAQQFLILVNELLGKRARLKLTAFLIVVISFSLYANNAWLHFNPVWFVPVSSLTVSWISLSWLLGRRRKEFDETFPDALNILMSAVTAGESINQGFSYVGKTLDNTIGYEFKDISDRMMLGESVDDIFERSCKKFPYPAFLFFVITIRANMARGGQLKSVMGRLIRVLVEARNLEKKKMAMTSEARISAKIVGAIPLIFMIGLKYMSPEDFNFVLFAPEGRGILYYVVGSETLGLFIVWMLVRGAK
ncbi:type II secretion system F family protein [Vibrio sp. SS-MA-C1-2]|uniref:type II secretion system F family protein n=1 Tax=Vibrio sp. SS-MA-C1-2 TaxID=2908646 RepID=UPI001F369019|nr:type II secretion system F family protein [Vibrio sp. SS-MA-C1-2]UJF17515.1 type II secretion system F family protein [Vibrio sp. SS-MA-C1-2]